MPPAAAASAGDAGLRRIVQEIGDLLVADPGARVHELWEQLRREHARVTTAAATSSSGSGSRTRADSDPSPSFHLWAVDNVPAPTLDAVGPCLFPETLKPDRSTKSQPQILSRINSVAKCYATTPTALFLLFNKAIRCRKVCRALHILHEREPAASIQDIYRRMDSQQQNAASESTKTRAGRQPHANRSIEAAISTWHPDIWALASGKKTKKDGRPGNEARQEPGEDSASDSDDQNPNPNTQVSPDHSAPDMADSGADDADVRNTSVGSSKHPPSPQVSDDTNLPLPSQATDFHRLSTVAEEEEDQREEEEGQDFPDAAFGDDSDSFVDLGHDLQSKSDNGSPLAELPEPAEASIFDGDAEDVDSTMSIEQGRKETRQLTFLPEEDELLNFPDSDPCSVNTSPSRTGEDTGALDKPASSAYQFNEPAEKIEVVPSGLFDRTPPKYAEKTNGPLDFQSNKPPQHWASSSKTEIIKKHKRRLTGKWEERSSPALEQPPRKRPSIRAAAIDGMTARISMLVHDYCKKEDGNGGATRDRDATMKEGQLCSLADLSTLAPAVRVNDGAIKSCLDILALTRNDIVSVDSLLVRPLPSQSSPDADPPHRQARNAKITFEVAKATRGGKQGLLLVPVHLRALEHWALVVVTLSAAGIARLDLYDSLLPRDPAAEQDRLKLVQQCLSGILPCLLPSVKFQPLKARLCPRQTNDYDCGLFTIAAAFFLVSGLPLPPRIDGSLWRRVLLSLLDPTTPSQANGSRLPLISQAITAWDDKPLVKVAALNLPPPTVLPNQALLSAREFDEYQAADAARLEKINAISRAHYAKVLAGPLEAAARISGDLQDAVDIFKSMVASTQKAGDTVATTIEEHAVDEGSLMSILAEHPRNKNNHSSDGTSGDCHMPATERMDVDDNGDDDGEQEHTLGNAGTWRRRLSGVQQELEGLRKLKALQSTVVALFERLLSDCLLKELDDVTRARERMLART